METGEKPVSPLVPVVAGTRESNDGPLKSEIPGELDTVDLDDANDLQSPINWSRGYKWLVVGILSAMALVT